MDFFAHQEAARRQTGRLVFLFGLSLAGIIAAIYLLALVAFGVGDTTRASVDSFDHLGDFANDPMGHDPGPASDPLRTTGWFRLDLLGGVTIGVLGIVGVASLIKSAQLRGGGAVVAAQLGGTLITHDTADALEKRALNIVEEMAIASGIAAPPVFILRNESGINAFAAGWGPNDAAIGITRGCLETLSRDELQGVIAHEFSHIFNGDMRLNIRLMGLVFGILAIHVIGRILLRASFYGSIGRSSRNNNGHMALVLIGAALAGIGAIGAMFGSLIRASVSRQREFLADASAVQFTRNPDGIAGALKKIAGFVEGSRIRSPRAEEASHMFFGSAMLSGVAGLFATHPPLPIRIRRIDPSWDGKVQPIRRTEAVGSVVGLEGAAAFAPAAVPTSPTTMHRLSTRTTNASAVEWIGRLGPGHVTRAREIIHSAPPQLVEAARSAYSARAAIFALLLDRTPEVRHRQMDRIGEAGEPGLVAETVRLEPLARHLPPEARAPVAEIALGALSSITYPQYQRFRTTLRGLVEADAKRNVFEWMLERLAEASLGARFEGAATGIPEYYALSRLGSECSMVLSMLAHASGADFEEARRAFHAGVSALPEVAVAFIPAEACSLSGLSRALDRLATVTPTLKRTIVTACARVVAADARAATQEIELLRGVSASLGAPMPPVLPGQRLVN